MKVYFLPGMCVNCKVFDKIILPEGYEKVYIEWLPPNDKPFEEYARQMAASIDSSEPFMLVGYSMGGLIVQEMNHFLTPEKNILISSMKHKAEIPRLFRLLKKTRIYKYLPLQICRFNSRMSYLIAQFMLSMNTEEIELCVAYTSSEYMKWAVYHLTEWTPKSKISNLFHIHGTKDEIFPFKQVKNVFAIEDGNHIMILRKVEEINRILNQIITNY